jgi:hypothetical protein
MSAMLALIRVQSVIDSRRQDQNDPRKFVLGLETPLRSEGMLMPVSRSTKLTLGCKSSDAHIPVRLLEIPLARP